MCQVLEAEKLVAPLVPAAARPPAPSDRVPFTNPSSWATFLALLVSFLSGGRK